MNNKMMPYIKIPIVIGAIRITESAFSDENPNPQHIEGVIYDLVKKQVKINTLEGEMIGNVGDWIIRGVKGELYPCKPDIFELTYKCYIEE